MNATFVKMILALFLGSFFSCSAPETQPRHETAIEKNISAKHDQNHTAFFVAIKEKDYSTLDTIISKGIDINIENQNQMTALILAAFNGDCELVKYLLNHNANVNAVDGIGRSSLIFSSYAAFNPDYCTTKLLIEKGADVNICDNIGLTPLMGSLNYQISELLIKNKANVNKQSKSGYTALQYASRYGKKELIELLLLNGADRELKNNEGEDALTIAKKQGNNEVIGILEK